MAEQLVYQSEVITLIKNEAQKDPNFFKELLKNKNQSVIAIFRSLPSITKHLVIRRVYLGQPSLDLYESQCPRAATHFQPLLDLGLGFIRPNQKNPKAQDVVFIQEFSEGIRDIVDGNSQPCLQPANVDGRPTIEVIDQWKKECQTQWKKLFNVISQPDKMERQDYGKRIMATLHNSKLLQKNSDIGFQFILTSTRQQINMLISHYIKWMIEIYKKPVDIGIIRFVLQLSLLDPHQYFQILPERMQQYELDILEDFHQLGFVSKTQTTLRISYLLWNFLYEQPVNRYQSYDQQVSIDIRCDIIVEANFRVYAYLESRDPMEESILFNLLSLFTEIKYRFPNLIIADLNFQSVAKAYKSNLKASQIIQFFEINSKYATQPQNEAEAKEKEKDKSQLKQTTQQEVKKRLSFLRVFSQESNQQNPILPHNIVQQLNFWEQETKTPQNENF